MPLIISGTQLAIAAPTTTIDGENPQDPPTDDAVVSEKTAQNPSSAQDTFQAAPPTPQEIPSTIERGRFAATSPPLTSAPSIPPTAQNHTSTTVGYASLLGEPAKNFLSECERLSWKKAITPLLKSVYRISDKDTEDVLILLEGHCHLVPDWHRELAESIDRATKVNPISATSYADAILRWKEFKEQGATDESREGILTALKRGMTIAPPPSYVNSGTIVVREAKMRNLREEDRTKLITHPLISFLETNILESLEIDNGGLFFDLLENLPEKLKKTLLSDLGFLYDETKNEITKNGALHDITPDDYPLLLNALISLLAETEDRAKITDISKTILAFLCKHLYETFPAFREGIEKIRKLIDEISSIKANANPDDLLSSLYQRSREIYTHIFLDAPLNSFAEKMAEAFLQKSKIPDDSQVTEKLSKVGVIVMEGKPVNEAITAQIRDLEKEIKNTEQSKENARILADLNKKLKVLRSIDRTNVEKLTRVRTWRELQSYAAAVFNDDNKDDFVNRLKIGWSEFQNIYNTFISNLQSFGMYFEEQELSSTMTLHLTPVAGLLAAIAIDTGSDCGKGKATDRASLGLYGVAMITKKGNNSVPCGYVGSFLAHSEKSGELIMIDAINPSTQLDISGESLLAEMQKYFLGILQNTQLQAVLISHERNLVSNRASIEQASEKASYPTAVDSVGEITTDPRFYEDSMANVIKNLSPTEKAQLAEKLRGQIKDHFLEELSEKIAKAQNKFTDKNSKKDIARKLRKKFFTLKSPEKILEILLKKIRAMYGNPNLTKEKLRIELYELIRKLENMLEIKIQSLEKTRDFNHNRSLFILENFLNGMYDNKKISIDGDEFLSGLTTYFLVGECGIDIPTFPRILFDACGKRILETMFQQGDLSAARIFVSLQNAESP